MNPVTLIALQALQQDQSTLERVGTNLANALTPGYKRSGTWYAALQAEVVPTFATWMTAHHQPLSPVQENVSRPLTTQAIGKLAEAASAGVGVGNPGNHNGTYLDLRPGTLKPTGRSLDLALAGAGFFEVQAGAALAYARQGNFSLDGRGRLVTAQGDPVMGVDGEIVLDSDAVRIDGKGYIHAADRAEGNTGLTSQMSMASGLADRGAGGLSGVGNPNAAGASTSLGNPGTYGASGLASRPPLARLKIVDFTQPQALRPAGAGLFVTGEAPAALPEADIDVRQATLENANTDSLQEMLSMMAAMRHAETMARLVQGHDAMLGNAIRTLGSPS